MGAAVDHEGDSAAAEHLDEKIDGQGQSADGQGRSSDGEVQRVAGEESERHSEVDRNKEVNGDDQTGMAGRSCREDGEDEGVSDGVKASGEDGEEKRRTEVSPCGEDGTVATSCITPDVTAHSQPSWQGGCGAAGANVSNDDVHLQSGASSSAAAASSETKRGMSPDAAVDREGGSDVASPSVSAPVGERAASQPRDGSAPVTPPGAGLGGAPSGDATPPHDCQQASVSQRTERSQLAQNNISV